MVNLCDILGSFVSGHLQRHLHADQIGLGCAVIVLVALVAISITLYRKERKRIENPPKYHTYLQKNRKYLPLIYVSVG